MKKEYRISDEKREDQLPSCLSFLLFLGAILYLTLLAIEHSTLWVYLMVLFYLFLVWNNEVQRTFYVIIEEDKLTIRNRKLSSWLQEYKYGDIDEVCFKGGKQYTFPFIQVRLKNGKKSRNFSISVLVDPARYQELVDDLRAKGVRVTLSKMKGVK